MLLRRPVESVMDRLRLATSTSRSGHFSTAAWACRPTLFRPGMLSAAGFSPPIRISHACALREAVHTILEAVRRPSWLSTARTATRSFSLVYQKRECGTGRGSRCRKQRTARRVLRRLRKLGANPCKGRQLVSTISPASSRDWSFRFPHPPGVSAKGLRRDSSFPHSRLGREATPLPSRRSPNEGKDAVCRSRRTGSGVTFGYTRMFRV